MGLQFLVFLKLLNCQHIQTFQAIDHIQFFLRCSLIQDQSSIYLHIQEKNLFPAHGQSEPAKREKFQITTVSLKLFKISLVSRARTVHGLLISRTIFVNRLLNFSHSLSLPKTKIYISFLAIFVPPICGTFFCFATHETCCPKP